MLCGAYYLQAGHLTRASLLLSASAALFIFALVLVNELPDYYQDLLVDKRNLVVRLGRRRAALLYGAALALAYAAVVTGLLLRAIPPAAALFLPTGFVAWRAARTAIRQAESPQDIVPAIRATILLFSGFLAFAALTYLI
jgi:1,4-dihydroxy-2-naphthoate octaprenyltransferase